LKNRLHAAEGSAATPRCVLVDLRRSVTGLEKRLLRLRRAAREAIGGDAGLQRKFEQLTGITGIGEVSAVQLLGELAGLDPEMTVLGRPQRTRSGASGLRNVGA
jgi:transposase